METQLKKRILSFIENNNDGSQETMSLIECLKDDLYYADCNTHSVSVDDLNNLPGKTQMILHQKLGKDLHDNYTIEDCEKVADAIAEFISEEYSEDIINAIEYQL